MCFVKKSDRFDKISKPMNFVNTRKMFFFFLFYFILCYFIFLHSGLSHLTACYLVSSKTKLDKVIYLKLFMLSVVPR